MSYIEDLIQIVELKSSSTHESIFERCIELNIPVYCKLPSGYAVWAVDKKDDAYYGRDIVKREISRQKLSERSRRSINQPAVVTKDDTIVMLGSSLIEQLCVKGHMQVSEVDAVLTKSLKETRYELVKSIPMRVSDTVTMMCLGAASLSTINDCSRFNFYISSTNFSYMGKDTLQYLIEDCLISKSDASLIARISDVHMIPKESPYYLDEDCRSSSELKWLALQGHNFYEAEIEKAPVRLVDYLMKERSCTRKQAEAGALFMRKGAKGKGCRLDPNHTHFPELIKAFRYYYTGEGSSTKKPIHQLLSSFDERKAKDAGYWITPDKA